MRIRCNLAIAWAIALALPAAGVVVTESTVRTVADPPPGYCVYVAPAPSTGWGGGYVCTP